MVKDEKTDAERGTWQGIKTFDDRKQEDNSTTQNLANEEAGDYTLRVAWGETCRSGVGQDTWWPSSECKSLDGRFWRAAS